METYYVKKRSRYIPVGVNQGPDLFDGIWMVKSGDGRRSMSNLVYRLSDLPQPVDMQGVVSHLIYEDSLTKFFAEFFDDGNKNGKNLYGQKDDAKLYNIAVSDLSLAVLKFLHKESEKYKKTEKI